MVQWLYQLEEQTLLFVQNQVRNPILTPAMLVITTLGDAGAIWIVISGGLCMTKKWRKMGEMGICSILLSLLVNNVFLKHLVARSRPFDVIAALHPLIAKPTDYSFPSGHTACSFAVGFLLFRKLPKKAGIPCLLLVILIGLSRIYVGVHYPSDVIAGAISGIAIGYVAEKLVDFAEKKKLMREEKSA